MTQAVGVAERIEAPANGTWEIDPSHSSVVFVIRHLMITNVRGRFSRFSGTLHIADAPEESWVEVSIDAASIDTNLGDRDDHLRSPDFLNVAQFPTISFRSTSVQLLGDTRLRVAGDLTIRDVTRPVALDGIFEGVVRDPWGDTRAAFSAATELDREEFDVTWNQALEAGGFVVGKKLKIQIEVEAVHQAAELAA